MKKKILFITRGEYDASTRYRVTPLIPLLQERGWSTRQLSRHSKFLRSRMLLASLSGQTIFIQRKLFGVPFLALLRLTRPQIIFDFDDAVYVKRSGKSAKRTHKQFASIIRAASLVIAGNKLLAETAAAERGDRPIVMAPTSVASSKYASAPMLGKACDLVWIGSRSTGKYLDSASDAFTEIARMRPGTSLKIIGDFQWDHPALTVTCAPWSEETEAGELKSCAIGIAPMPDSDWTRGKCALKVMQYMAAGLPVVASEVGVHAEIIRDNENGILATSSRAWANAIQLLIQDRELANRMGKNGFETVSRIFEETTNSVHAADAIDALRADRKVQSVNRALFLHRTSPSEK